MQKRVEQSNKSTPSIMMGQAHGEILALKVRHFLRQRVARIPAGKNQTPLAAIKTQTFNMGVHGRVTQVDSAGALSTL